MNQELITIVHSEFTAALQQVYKLVSLQTCKLACRPKCTRLVNPRKIYLFDLCGSRLCSFASFSYTACSILLLIHCSL